MPSTPSMVGWASGPPVAPPSTGLFRTASMMRLRASWKSRSSSEPWPAFLSNRPPSGRPAALWLLPFASVAMIGLLVRFGEAMRGGVPEGSCA